MLANQSVHEPRQPQDIDSICFLNGREQQPNRTAPANSICMGTSLELTASME